MNPALPNITPCRGDVGEGNRRKDGDRKLGIRKKGKSGVKKITFVLGGARSGKSSYAVELAKRLNKEVTFIATASRTDKEMQERIKKHRLSRPGHWKVIEEGKNISAVLSELNNKDEVILIDCLGLFISNLMMDNLDDNEVEDRLKELIENIKRRALSAILVSNEVGSGIVPDNALARRFRDLLGLSNQMLAKSADKVVLVQSGIPVTIKDNTESTE
ncbi:MAG: bifunctional adenosylcobinamide kinase/adenosylcobinamide-phosphate guanylyltransferase [Candidatus Omnitrophota bacterium]|nr:MAG: bifunctional adenosylcobinamide kinase/adenosylcobinamide-phosphate guanylyltransferase [Candidatus Omnitrophota bacterium]